MLPMIDTDEVLKQMTAQAVEQGENLRSAVRDVTLRALQSRELSLAQIKQVVKKVTEGVNLGAMQSGLDPEDAFEQAFAGMDDALLKAVEASRVAISQITGDREFRDSNLKKALGELERLEDEFIETVKKASSGAGAQFKSQWAGVLDDRMEAGTATGQQAMAMIEQYGDQIRAAARVQREAGFKAAHALAQNFYTLASGVLIGMSEAINAAGKAAAGPKPAAKSRRR